MCASGGCVYRRHDVVRDALSEWLEGIDAGLFGDLDIHTNGSADYKPPPPPPLAGAGQSVPLRVRIINNKAGHDFPTGPLDIIQAWLEIQVVADDGTVVFHSGAMDEDHFIDTGEGEDAAGIARIDQAVVPKPRRGVKRVGT